MPLPLLSLGLVGLSVSSRSPDDSVSRVLMVDGDEATEPVGPVPASVCGVSAAADVATEMAASARR